jgi:hypothetical protein
MKTLLSVKIPESQKGEFPDLTDQLGSFPSVPDFTDFTFFSSPAQSPGVRRALFSGALLAVNCDYQ